MGCDKEGKLRNTIQTVHLLVLCSCCGWSLLNFCFVVSDYRKEEDGKVAPYVFPAEIVLLVCA